MKRLKACSMHIDDDYGWKYFMKYNNSQMIFGRYLYLKICVHRLPEYTLSMSFSPSPETLVRQEWGRYKEKHCKGLFIHSFRQKGWNIYDVQDRNNWYL